MTEHDAFETRFHDAVRGYAARASSDLDPVGQQAQGLRGDQARQADPHDDPRAGA